jgi:hypothetical protein
MLVGVISNLRGLAVLTLAELSLLWVKLIAFVVLFGAPILCALALWRTLWSAMQ